MHTYCLVVHHTCQNRNIYKTLQPHTKSMQIHNIQVVLYYYWASFNQMNICHSLLRNSGPETWTFKWPMQRCNVMPYSCIYWISNTANNKVTETGTCSMHHYTSVIPEDNLNVTITFVEQINVQLTNTAREQKIWNKNLFKVTSQCMRIIQTR